uniref:F-box domain-containing protein n=1 Tax=Mycena chlorophos TaxID=658473 RepID=A0ABQ0MAJ7_MYCCL|nr:predicted protein [Mycena chlorophos]
MLGLHDLPPELLEHIFSFACTDTGTTGRALSLVSRYVRDTSATNKLQSIALFGRVQILKFSNFLRSRDAEPARTRFLYIGGAKSLEVDLNELAERRLNDNLTTEEQGYLDSLTGDHPQDVDITGSAFGRPAADAISDILRHLAPTLQVLYIHVNKYIAQELLVDQTISLPRLETLTSWTGFPMRFNMRDNLECSLVPSSALRQLHVVDSDVHDQGCTPEAMFLDQGIRHFAPQLETLRISDLGSHYSERVPPCISLGIGVDIGAPYLWPELINPLPESLREILLKPAYFEPEIIHRVQQYQDVLREARRLAQHSQRVVLLRVDEKAPGPDRFLDEWLDNAGGRPILYDLPEVDIRSCVGEEHENR